DAGSQPSIRQDTKLLLPDRTDTTPRFRSSSCLEEAFAGFVGGALLGAAPVVGGAEVGGVPVVGGADVGGAEVGGLDVVGAAVVGAVEPVHTVPLSVRDVGAGWLELFQEPLKPNDVFAPVAMGAL